MFTALLRRTLLALALSLGDKPGARWGCTMVIRATKHADDHFLGEFEGSIDSAAEGHLYTGTREFAAARME